MIGRHKRTSIAILSTITLAMVFLFTFQLLQPDSEAHDMCKSKRDAVKRARSSVSNAEARLVSARKSLTRAIAALEACERKHRDIHDDPG